MPCQVSNPHRYGQKSGQSGHLHLPRVVSNPHRYGQKAALARIRAMGMEVSNPHRYGQKQIEGRLQTETYEAFQTLIGTVKSDEIKEGKPISEKSFKPS